MHRRVDEFCERYGLRIPVFEAPMAGACPPELAIAVAEAGGMGANGVVLDPPDWIAGWVERFRDGSAGRLQLNVWVPDPPVDDPGRTAAATAFLHRFGPPARRAGRCPRSPCSAGPCVRPADSASRSEHLVLALVGG
jgi:nitronate monooxygenase